MCICGALGADPGPDLSPTLPLSAARAVSALNWPCSEENIARAIAVTLTFALQA
jgi:hypothetical protein